MRKSCFQEWLFFHQHNSSIEILLLMWGGTEICAYSCSYFRETSIDMRNAAHLNYINDGELFSKVSECIISVDKFPSKPYAQEDGIMEGEKWRNSGLSYFLEWLYMHIDKSYCFSFISYKLGGINVRFHPRKYFFPPFICCRI